jgi:hypothetical protein
MWLTVPWLPLCYHTGTSHFKVLIATSGPLHGICIIFLHFWPVNYACSSLSVLLAQYCAGDKIEKNEMGGHVVRMGREVAREGFWWGNLRETAHWGDPDVDGRVILR